ncbi:hemerythrin domain-containing protein [Dechloromonas sp. ZY10]|uniref:hemerythrin domain-containing protein n=1 Tax=Dechloromonas aquae TaxID=2664436 RepID=UPI003527FFE9
MRRHPRLLHFSREHHLALRLAKHASAAGSSLPVAEVAAEVAGVRTELLRHFAAEEEELFPELAAHQLTELHRRLLAEHRELSALLASPDDAVRLQRLGELLRGHVHFEERELFPALEAGWPADE